MQGATIHHAACIDVQLGPLQMRRHISSGWLTPLDSIKQGFRACWGRVHVALMAGAAFPQLLSCNMKLITNVRTAQESAVLASDVCSGFCSAACDSLFPGNLRLTV